MKHRGGLMKLAILLLSPFILLELALFALPFDPALLDGFPESRRFLDADGRLLREVVGAGGTRARWTPLAEISPLLVDAVLAVEDTRFWDHSGVDRISVARAAWGNTRQGRVVSGASTLTMQLSRLTQNHPRSYGGKLAQAFGALALERAVSKQVILEHYLNRAPFGTGSIGAEAASQRYLGKPTAHLSLSEAALLAGLLQSPASLNPLRHEERARQRQHHVLDRMLEVGMISPEEHERARRQPWTFQPRPPQPAAMHFTEYLLAGPLFTKDLPTGDVVTTVDGVLQAEIEQMVTEHVRVLAPGGLTQAAVVVLDNRQCEILALVGSTDYWSEDGAVNGATARRQPGSALKPFTYALGFERLYTPATIVADVETRYHGRQGEFYSPRNYSETYSGPLLMGEALGRSLNVPAIRVANGVGTSVLLERLRAAGFASLDQPAPHYGLGLTLGNGEVTLLELAQGFALFARQGRSCTAHGLRAQGPDNTALEPPRQVFSPEVSYLITDILSDEDLRIRAFGASNPLLLGFPMAVKTGTSSNWRDNWAVGYTERYTVAVWTGDFQGRSMNQLSGAIGAGPLFHNVARRVVERGGIQASPRLPPAPEGVEEILVCPLSGMAAGEHCPHRRSVAVLETAPNNVGDGPRDTCSWHRRLRVDQRNGLLASERCPDRFVDWRVFEILPPRYAEWQASQGVGRPPTRYSPLCPETGLMADALVITHPRDGEIFLLEPGYDPETQSLRLTAEVDPPLPEVTWLVNGQVVASASWPYEASWRLARGRHRLEVLSGGRRSDPVELEVR